MQIKQKRMIIISLQIALAVLLVISIILIVIGVRDASDDKEPRVINITIDTPPDISLEEKEKIVYQSLIAAGYSSAGACGIMGNIAVESPEFDPTAVNESNGALGLFQWNNVGDRQQHFKDFCKEQKMNWNLIESQLAYAVYELSGADPIACRLDDLLKQTDDPYTAAAEFAAGFERCISDSGRAKDVYTGSLYPEFYGEHYQGLAKRINKAMNYYERFKNADNESDDDEITITIE